MFFALDNIVTVYSNWYKNYGIHRPNTSEVYILFQASISKEKTLFLSTDETVFRLLGSNCSPGCSSIQISKIEKFHSFIDV